MRRSLALLEGPTESFGSPFHLPILEQPSGGF
jgi:hypothetical protein